MRGLGLGLGLSLGGGSAAAASTPATIFGTSLVAWWRGDSLTQSGGVVTGWTDKSTNGNTLSVTAGGPTYNASSASLTPAGPTASFAGTDTMAKTALANSASGKPAAVFMVLRLADTTARNLLTWPIGAVGNGISLFSISSAKPQNNTQAGNAIWSGAAINGVTRALVATIDGVVGTSSVSTINISNGTANTATGGNAGATVASATLTLSPLSPFSGFKGEIAEVVVVGALPTSGQFAAYESYAQGQFGVA